MCQPPELQEHDGGWVMRFFYWNPAGGVEMWRASGDALRIVSIYRDYAAPDGSFPPRE